MYKVDLDNKLLVPLEPTTLTAHGILERFDLQEWVEKCPRILGEELLVIGKEIPLSSGARLDLLAIDKSAALVVIELKRDDSGSNVEWQALRYASYCGSLLAEEAVREYAAYQGVEEDEAQKVISAFIDEEMDSLNNTQRIILCARKFHSDVISTVLWLRDFEIDITCVRLAPFSNEDGEIYIHPDIIIPLPEAKNYIEKRERKVKEEKQRQPWSGYWFVNVGESEHRNWEDNVKFGYVSAGQGRWASSGLERLHVGDRIFAYIKGAGYVGYGRVVSEATRIRDFVVSSIGAPLLDQDLKAPNAQSNADDGELTEYCVGVEWFKTLPRNEAKTFKGVFANQNIACKLRHKETFDFLCEHFDVLSSD